MLTVCKFRLDSATNDLHFFHNRFGFSNGRLYNCESAKHFQSIRACDTTFSLFKLIDGSPILDLQQGVTLTSVQGVTVTAPAQTVTSPVSSASDSNGSSSGGLSSGAKLGIGVGVGVGAGVALLALLGFLLWRRRKARVGDDFKWPELGDGTGSGGTAAGLYPNPTHPTGNNRFDMDDEELFDEPDGAASTTAHGSGGGKAPMMSERDPSFLSSAAGTAGGGGASYLGGNPAGYGAAAAGAAGLAGVGGAAAAAAAGHNRYGSQGEGDYYSQDGHYPSAYPSPPGSNYTHGNMSPPPPQQPHGPAMQNYAYDPASQQHHFYNPGLPAGAALGAAGSTGLGRTGSIASTTAGGYQVGAFPSYENDGDADSTMTRDRQRNRNRLSVVNNLGDVGEED